ncbi:MAG: NAD(+) synthase [Spirochaetaceae bacterium]|nr:MAG: NAD(+) synthase [Spirochaetaceae bacterium]
MDRPFDCLYSHGFARVAVAVPHGTPADPAHNVEAVLALADQASREHAALVLFPELCLSSYAIDDLLQQEALLAASVRGLERILLESLRLEPVIVVGLPLAVADGLYNCAVALVRGRILGVTPKSFLPNYREFYEKRHFQPAAACPVREIRLLGQTVPFGADLIFSATTLPGFIFHMELCEDLWVPIPPSTHAAMAGATVLTNLSASNITIGKADYRRMLAASQSGRTISAYLYSAAGHGESTTDLAWDGHALVFENNHLLAETERFSTSEQLLCADLDLEALRADRLRSTTFHDSVRAHREAVSRVRTVAYEWPLPDTAVPLARSVAKFPYVPADPSVRNERCFEAYNIQVSALHQRLEATGIAKLVIGVSGGLDSTHALIVAAKAMDRLGRPRSDILAYTMPGYATSNRTRENAIALMQSLGVTWQEIDIRPACEQMFADIGHPFARGEKQYDVTFENVQAGQRTSILFRLANQHGGLVLGTGDLSELALGWATYGVGDHMSHYAVNCSVPKTLIRYLIQWNIETHQFAQPTLDVLALVLETEISPELVPSDGGTLQSTEGTIGPYELQDFHLYYVSRYGFCPSRVAFLAQHAWGDRYTPAEIRKWLRVFLTRFFGSSQFKRSCIPNGPKVGSGGSLSPRGDWRAPSDGSPAAWLAELDAHTPDR